MFVGISFTKGETVNCHLVATLLEEENLELLEDDESEGVAEHIHTCKTCFHRFREHQKRRGNKWITSHMPLFLTYVQQVQYFINTTFEAQASIRRAVHMRPNKDRMQRFPFEIAYEVVCHRICDHSAPSETLSEADITATIEDLLSEWIRSGHA